MQRKSILDEILSGVGDAVADVREKYEEAVFGRAVTEPDTEPRLWAAREAETAPTQEQEQGRDRADRDTEIDR
jgi:hypothetical protein